MTPHQPPNELTPLSEESYQSIPTALLNDLGRTGTNGKPKLAINDIAIFAFLKAHAWGGKDWCNVGYERIAELARCSDTTVYHSLVRLENAGHIQRKSATGGFRIHILTDVQRGKVIRRLPRIRPRSLSVTEVPLALPTVPSMTNMPPTKTPKRLDDTIETPDDDNDNDMPF